MSSETLPLSGTPPAGERSAAEGPDGLGTMVGKLLRPLASLRLTVVLFAMAVFLIFAGTLAQARLDMWAVIETYFRSWFVWIRFQIFFPPSFFPSRPQVPGGIPFLGGKAIGLAMAVNLLAAHGVRFRIQVRQARLWWGLAVIVAGTLLTWLVIEGGHSERGLQGKPPFSYTTLWSGLKLTILALWTALIVGTVTLKGNRLVERILLGTCALGLGCLLVWLTVLRSEFQPSDSALRILWQLIQGGLAGVVLLVGCIMVFKKRGAIVLIHVGIALLMFNELLVGLCAVEERLTIREGESAQFARDIRSVEMAIVDTSGTEFDEVVVIPERRLRRRQPIEHELLPFNVQVVQYHPNAVLRQVAPTDDNPATAGTGTQLRAQEVRGGSGADSSGEVDMAAAYVKLTDKTTDEPLGTYLLSQILSGQDRTEKVTVGQTTYDVALRFKRTYKPYSMSLVDVRKDDYIGTSTPMNYSSLVHLVDPQRNVDREILIWMNNPLRYAGETFYQSGYYREPGGTEVTTLQVVTNRGWMIPYVACMLVAIGLLVHFSSTLVRFVNRLSRGATTDHRIEAAVVAAGGGTPRGGKKQRKARQSHASGAGWPVTAAAVLVGLLLCVGWLAGKARGPEASDDAIDLAAAGRLPVVFEGRIKPLDTVARNSLNIISDRGVFHDADGNEQPAIRWLMDVISGSAAAEKHRVFYIPNLEVQKTLGLERRKRFRYAVEEFQPQMAEFEKQVMLARRQDAEALSTYQRKVLELDKRIRRVTLLLAAFRPMSLPPLPGTDDFEQDRDQAMQMVRQFTQTVSARADQLAEMQPPLAVYVPSTTDQNPSETSTESGTWQPYSTAWTRAYVAHYLMGQEPDPATAAWESLLHAYAAGNASLFNQQVHSYLAQMGADPPADLDERKVAFESWFNHFSPFYHASVLYVFAFALTVTGLLVAAAVPRWRTPFLWTALAVIALTLVVHTFALGGRIYISGRPPVTNLYSSAVFIGWSCVVFGLVLEVIFRLGVGNLVASVAGFLTLLIAYYLSRNGDTFTVLQAVLDTQFWLATHVVSIAIGYATTFVAGLLGIIYVLCGVCTPVLNRNLGRILSSMIYGVVCFAIFFSLVGTVLGGLWADDSWGRFWGWDPKENGALIIVLWNALILHARWGGMVKERGLAVLAIAGNIVTAWSWFGVNELGVGLHSYGFTEGVLRTLMIFAASQLLLMVLGCLPREMWWSSRRQLGLT